MAASIFRKNFLHLKCFGNQLRGIGGPGAPHVFAFDRFEDLGLVSKDVSLDNH